MANAAQQAMDKQRLPVLADRGYFNRPEIKACMEAGVIPLVPKPMTSGAKAEGRLSKADFIYVAKEDMYRCPAGQLAKYRMCSRVSTRPRPGAARDHPPLSGMAKQTQTQIDVCSFSWSVPGPTDLCCRDRFRADHLGRNCEPDLQACVVAASSDAVGTRSWRFRSAASLGGNRYGSSRPSVPTVRNTWNTQEDLVILLNTQGRHVIDF